MAPRRGRRETLPLRLTEVPSLTTVVPAQPYPPLTGRNPLKLKLRNLGVAPVARLLRSTPLTQPAGHRRAELSVTGMICAL